MSVKIEQRIGMLIEKNRDRILTFLKEIVECDSNTANKTGVDRVGKRITSEMPNGFKQEVFHQEKYGDHLVFHYQRPPLLPVVLGGHMDTLSPPGFDKLTTDGDFLRGSGTADMKGGLVVLVWSLKILEMCGLLEKIPVTCLFNSDEEVNSPTSKDLFTGIKGKVSAGIIFECAGQGNSVVTTRRGIDVYDLAITGKPAHSGLITGHKASAILEAAHKVLQVEALNRPDRSLTANVGIINGGVAYNLVPDNASFNFELRYWDPAIGSETMQEIERIAGTPAVAGCNITFRQCSSRPPMVSGDAGKYLYQTAFDVASKLGQPLPSEARGGVSDANWLTHVGIPTIDGLGPIGFDDHTGQEHIIAETLFQRISLTANLLLNLEYRKAG